jgi:autotransporter-associated beta strand protein
MFPLQPVMKPKMVKPLAALFLGSVLAITPAVSAATFNWTRLVSGNASGSWATQAWWSGGTLPTTTNDTANFNALDITADSTVTLDGNRTIKALAFGDTNSASGANWFLASGTPASATLTLGGSSPTVDVSGLAAGKSVVISAVLAGTNGLTKTGDGYLTLNAANTYSGTTILSPQVGNGGISCNHDSAFGTSKVQIGATAGDSQAWFQSGGNHTLTNNFEIRAVRWIINSMQVGPNPAGDLTLGGSVYLNQGALNVRDIYCLKNLTLNGSVTSTGGLNKHGPNTLTLNGTNTYSGGTAINAGTLQVNGRISSPGAVTVISGSILGGSGVITGPVSVQDGGTLLPGTNGSGTFTLGALSATTNASITFALGAPNNSSNGFIRVNGNLTLAGRLNLTDLGGFSSGNYTSVWYSGTLSNLGWIPNQVPAGKSVLVRTDTPHYVVLQVANGFLYPTANQLVPMDQSNPMVLGWPQGVGVAGYDLYFGTSSNAVYTATTNTPSLYLGRSAAQTNTVGVLTPNTTYFWRVDNVAADGTVTRGLVLAFSTGAAMIDLMEDTWVATDALGRTLPGNAECGNPRPNRTIGAFYFLWHNYPAYGAGTNWDVSRWIAGHPYTNPLNPWADNPIFQQYSATYYWGEPALGYYMPTDPWMLRRQIALLTHAGVDVLIMDYSNAVTYDSELYALCDMIRQMRSEGFQTNLKIVFLTHAASAATVTYVYNTFYAANKYPDLWFYWKGKPLVLGYINGADPTDPAPSATVQNYFTWRQSWAWEGGLDKMAWIDSTTPQQFGYHDAADHPESTPVTCGGWSSSNIGHSYTNHTQPAYNNYHLPVSGTQDKGLFFAEQMNFGLKLDPDFLFITSWNEWIAGAFQSPSAGAVYMLGQPCPANGFYFVDEYNEEYSRDIEPMKGGHTDNYYFQMVGQNRLRKGVRPIPVASAPQTINVGGDFTDWTNVGPLFFDAVNDTVWRNFPSSVSQNGSYTNTTGRNDFTLLKVARDDFYLYFLAQCASNITTHASNNWMVLFLDTDQNHATGWEGYDYAVNLGGAGATTTTLSRNTTATNGWNWATLRSNLPYKVSGNKLMVRIARADLGLAADPVSFDFHWADNYQVAGDISDFGINGDSAPDRRFNYRYQTAGQTQLSLARDDFESGKQAAWSGAWGPGCRWDLVGGTYYSASHCAECNLSHGSGNGALQMPLDPSGCSSLRVSFRYKLHGVNNATGVTVSYYGANGWVAIRNLGRDQYYPAGQAWGYDERQDVWLYFTDVRFNSGTNAQFFTNGMTFKIDGAPLSNGNQSIWVDDFQVTGVLSGQAVPAAGVVVKANNTASLIYGQSWVGGLPPVATNTARWDSTVTGPNFTLLGTDTSWNGLQILNPSGPVAINGATTLSLGAGGIDMSAASQSLTLNQNVSLLSTQSWNVANGLTLAVNGAIAGGGDLNKEGAGTLVLGGVDTFWGNLNLNAGLLALTNGNAIPDFCTVTLSNTAGAVLRIDASETIGALAGGGLGGGVNLGANSLTLAGTNASTSFSAQISGTGAVVKNGSGTMILTASNNFAGPWQINGGIVRIQDGNALGQGGFSAATWTLVANNAAVEIDGSLSVGEHMHILGRGPDDLGALRSVSGNSSLNQHIALDGNSSVGVSAGAALTQNFQFYNGSGPCTLTKIGAGTLTVNTFVFPSVLVAEGRFVNNGTLQGSVVVTNGGTLIGTGVIGGSLSVTGGGTLVPGSSLGVLTVSNAVSLAGTCVFAVQKIGGGTTNSQLAGITSLSYGGALVVSNLGGTLAAGDSFRLFSANSYGGHFASVSMPPLVPGLYWDSSQLAVNGTVRVATAPALSVSFSGSWLSLLWPTGYTGWLLEGQTNPVSLGLSTNWTLVPGLTSNGLSVPIAVSNGSVFFRLILSPP